MTADDRGARPRSHEIAIFFEAVTEGARLLSGRGLKIVRRTRRRDAKVRFAGGRNRGAGTEFKFKSCGTEGIGRARRIFRQASGGARSERQRRDIYVVFEVNDSQQ